MTEEMGAEQPKPNTSEIEVHISNDKKTNGADLHDAPVNLNGFRKKRPSHSNGSSGAEADIPLESSEAELYPDDFELYEHLLSENLNFSPDEAKEISERMAAAYYSKERKGRNYVVTAINGAFDAFASPNPDEEA